MKILVIGSCNLERSKKYLDQANELGYELAKRGHILVTSPSSGFQGFVASAYKLNNGIEFIGYYPELKCMEKSGEGVMVKPDTQIFTEQDYPIRNLLQVKGSDAVIAITGGTGTLTEVIAATEDYNLPTAFYEGSSPIIDSFRKIETDFSNKIKFGNNINDLLNYLEKSPRNSN
jgi:uncharacterized protein (TIGR00725 family)